MKLLIAFLFFTSYSLFSQSAKATSAPEPAKVPDVETPTKSTDTKSAKTVEPKSAPSKTAEAKTTPTKETAPKKELPPLQKDGGFLVLNGVKWQADNVTQKAYIIAKEECEKNGMRLPTRDELVDAYYSKYPEFRNPSGNYLSGNRRPSDRSTVWYVNFDNGHHNAGSLYREYNVRCVKVEEKATPTKTSSAKDTPAPAKTDISKDAPNESKK